jgi:hypothetical protein
MLFKSTNNIISVRDRLNGQVLKIQAKLRLTPMRIARLAQVNLRQQMLPNMWLGHVYNNILSHQLNETTAVVTSSIEGIYLDRMRTHAVRLTPRNLLWFWAYSKGNERVRKVADRQGWLTVKAHPFINTALHKTYDEVGTILSESIKVK